MNWRCRNCLLRRRRRKRGVGQATEKETLAYQNWRKPIRTIGKDNLLCPGSEWLKLSKSGVQRVTRLHRTPAALPPDSLLRWRRKRLRCQTEIIQGRITITVRVHGVLRRVPCTTEGLSFVNMMKWRQHAQTHRGGSECAVWKIKESIFTIHACSTEQGWCFIRIQVPRRGTVTVKSRGRERRTKTTQTRTLTGVSSKIPSAFMRLSPQEIYHRSQINDTIPYMESDLRLFDWIQQDRRNERKNVKYKM